MSMPRLLGTEISGASRAARGYKLPKLLTFFPVYFVQLSLYEKLYLARREEEICMAPI